MDARMEAGPPPQPEASAVAAAIEVEQLPENRAGGAIFVLVAKVQSLMDKIMENPDNPSPILINALSTILESVESSSMKDRDQSLTQITDLILNNDAFCQLISSKFLTDRRYSVSAKAATARLLCSCSPSLVDLLKYDVLDEIRDWVMDETPETFEWEMLRTYSIGLLAAFFNCNIYMEERFLSSGLPAKLMQILRVGVLGDANASKKEANLLIDCFQEFKVGHNDITDLVKKSVRAAEAEARTDKPQEAAVSAADVTAAEVIKTAAFEEYRTANDEEAALHAASRAASTLTDAANSVILSRYLNYIYGDSDHSKPELLPEIEEDIGKIFIVDSDSLSKLREKFCIEFLVAIVVLGINDEILDLLLHEKVVDVCLALVQKCVKTDEVSKYVLLWPEILRLVCELAEHQKFMELFLDRGGLQRLIAVPRIPRTFHRLSSFLCTISPVQSSMRRVCDLPSSDVRHVVELVFEILQSRHDIARTNASSFLMSAFIFKAVIDAFDAQHGLQKLLHHLHHSASVTSGASVKLTASEIQIAHETCAALHQYMRTHLLCFVDSILHVSSKAAYNLSDEAFDYVFSQIRKDHKLGPAFIRSRWPVVEQFISSNGHITMLELCQASRLTRPIQGSLQCILEILHIVTLIPYSREFIVSATLSNGRVGMAVILDVINTHANFEPEIVDQALHLLVNLVCPPPSIIVPSQQAFCTRTVNDPAMEKLEQGYRQAREAVRTHNGIKVLLQSLQTRTVTSHVDVVRRRALTCRVLLGLARDSKIARTLTKLQLGRKLLELNRDFGRQSSGGQHDRWQKELDQLIIELIAVITNSGCPRALAASDAATPTLRRIEKSAIAEATPISYNSRELLLLIHNHLQASGLPETAAKLVEEAKLTLFRSSQEQIQWPCGRALSGFFSDKYPEGSTHKKYSISRKNKPLPKIKINLKDTPRKSNSKIQLSSQRSELENAPVIIPRSSAESDTPIVLPKKRKLTHLKEICSERLTLDSMVVQYLKQQHRQCSDPITTLPPFSLLHPHVCRKPRQSLDSPSNVTARLRTCEIRTVYEGIDVNRKDRQFVYSRFRHRRTFHDNAKAYLTSIAFLEDSSRIACGFSRKIAVFNCNSKIVSESRACHTSFLTHLQSQSHSLGETQLLSSDSDQVCLWDASSLLDGPKYSVEGIKAARFSNSGTQFAALPSDSSQHEILLFDIQTSQLNLRLTDNTNSLYHRENPYSDIHFGPLSYMLLWDGVLWDTRSVSPIHHFEEFTDFGGGGFHPAANEVIINSEVWDLRNFKLLRSVPSLHQTVIKFNGGGDVIYAILRRDRRDISSAVAPRRMKHSLVSAFRTLDALNYSDIATIPVDRCVLDFATEPTDSVVGLIAVDYNGKLKGSSARIYDIGERKPIDGDYDRDLDVKYMYERDAANPLAVQFNRNWNNNNGDYDQDMIDLGEDGGESDGDDFEENVNDGEEDDDDDESDSDMSLNIYRSEDENDENIS